MNVNGGLVKTSSQQLPRPSIKQESREKIILKKAHELSEKEMKRLIFHDIDVDPPIDRSFEEQITLMEEQGIEFPCFFATTEY